VEKGRPHGQAWSQHARRRRQNRRTLQGAGRGARPCCLQRVAQQRCVLQRTGGPCATAARSRAVVHAWPPRTPPPPSPAPRAGACTSGPAPPVPPPVPPPVLPLHLPHPHGVGGELEGGWGGGAGGVGGGGVGAMLVAAGRVHLKRRAPRAGGVQGGRWLAASSPHPPTRCGMTMRTRRRAPAGAAVVVHTRAVAPTAPPAPRPTSHTPAAPCSCRPLLQRINISSGLTLGQLLPSYTYDMMEAHLVTRAVGYGRPLADVRLTDFFGGVVAAAAVTKRVRRATACPSLRCSSVWPGRGGAGQGWVTGPGPVHLPVAIARRRGPATVTRKACGTRPPLPACTTPPSENCQKCSFPACGTRTHPVALAFRVLSCSTEATHKCGRRSPASPNALAAPSPPDSRTPAPDPTARARAAPRPTLER
jgi:hypothetical protein